MCTLAGGQPATWFSSATIALAVPPSSVFLVAVIAAVTIESEEARAGSQ